MPWFLCRADPSSQTRRLPPRACWICCRTRPVWWTHREVSSLARKTLEDPLTGIANRRFLDTELECLCAATNAQRAVLSIVMIDVDHFKAFNDRYGHPRGDEVLKRVATAIQSIARRSDIVPSIKSPQMSLQRPDYKAAVGSWLAQNGQSLHLIGDVLNHRDPKTTAGYAIFPDPTAPGRVDRPR